ncbi:MAG: cardiolipin synthase [Prolixibacteraceae bacterium]|nr:cardiolipin synthase [Prolixibacteraceae bacterium]
MGVFDQYIPDTLQVVSAIFLLTSIAIAVIIVLEKRSPFKTAAWILVLVLIPVLGLIFYLFFGQDYRKRKIFSRKGLFELGKLRILISKQLRQINKKNFNFHQVPEGNEKLISLLLKNSNALLTTGNKAKILNNADATFNEIFASIEKAKHHIHLEYYIIENDEIGNRLKQLLIKKRREGVEVRIIVDDVGSWGLKKKFFRSLISEGIEIYPFMKVRFPRLTSKLNFRNHRKIAIIDGKTGFTGGINFADRYLKGIKKIGLWRDTHLKIEGDAVACLQVIFAADWFFVSGQNIEGKNYYTPFTEGQGIPIQIASSGPDSDWESIGQAFFSAIAGATKSVYITTPYLIPPQYILSALKTAALGGIDVQIIIPEKSDARFSKWCSFSFVQELLEAGVRMFFYQGGFIHSKLLMVDSALCSIGTTNLDFRSIETNFEVNAFIYDESFTKKLERFYKDDVAKSREIFLDEWQKRKLYKKIQESFAHMFSPLL